jgi:hypothetical protein
MTTVTMPASTIGSTSIPKVDYETVPLNNIHVTREEGTSNRASRIVSMDVEGIQQEIRCTDRFINSFLGLFGLSKSIFSLFDHSEVVERILQKGKGDRVRMALQQNTDGSATALAVSKPSKSYVDSFDLFEMLNKMGVDEFDINYSNGVVSSTHIPSVLGDSIVEVLGDEMVRRFVSSIPIDGYGKPSAYLSMIRLVCSNGLIGVAPSFKSELNIGNEQSIRNGMVVNDVIPVIRNFIESFNNEEGFHILTKRLETAAATPASLNEFSKLYKIFTHESMHGVHYRQDTGFAEVCDINSDVSRVMINLAGDDIMEKYGLVSLDQVSSKKRRLLPVDCSVSDLINFTSELATHRADAKQNLKLSAFVGQTLAEEFDLEGAQLEVSKNKDLYLTNYEKAHAHDDVRCLN